jgi:hypothetical protein
MKFVSCRLFGIEEAKGLFFDHDLGIGRGAFEVSDLGQRGKPLNFQLMII